MKEIHIKTEETDKEWWGVATPIEDALRAFAFDPETLGHLTIRGRIVAIREHKKTIFADIQDATGKIQVVVSRNINEETSSLQRGDILSVHGSCIRTKTGEPSLQLLDSHRFSSQIGDSTRLTESVENFERVQLIRRISIYTSNLRVQMLNSGFLEFETQILRENHEAGTARPFETKYNSLGKPAYLRLTMESELRKLQALGFERVFELGKSFRNEGRDRNHLPEFLLLEAYSAYTKLPELLSLFSAILHNALVETSKVMPVPDKKLFEQWEILEYPVIEQKVLELAQADTSEKSLEQKITSAIKKIIAPKIQVPTFLVHIPSRISPFAKQLEGNKNYSERAWAIAHGRTFCDIYEDETDPQTIYENLKWQDDNLTRGGHILHTENQMVELSKFGIPLSSSFGLSMNRLYLVINNLDDVRETEIFYDL